MFAPGFQADFGILLSKPAEKRLSSRKKSKLPLKMQPFVVELFCNGTIMVLMQQWFRFR
jgi:hypothetical protein